MTGGEHGGADAPLPRGGKQIGVGVLLLLAGSGCADPYGQFDEFSEALARKPAPPSGDCGDAVVQSVEGTFFVALSTQLGPKLPVVMLAEVTSDEAGMHMIWQPLAAADRQMPVGVAVELPSAPIDAEGKFTVELASIVVEAGANPLLDDDIEMAPLGLEGVVCEDLICGFWWGHLLHPIPMDLSPELNRFAMVRVDSLAYPEPPPINCVGDLADPIE